MFSTCGHVAVKFIGVLPDGSTGITVVNCQATKFDGRVSLFQPMINEYARHQLGLSFGQHFQGYTWYPIGEFVPREV